MNRPAPVSGQTRYILVVDSDWNERFTLSMLLQRFGYTVASTNSASEAVEFLCVAAATAIFAEAGDAGEDLIERLKTDVRFSSVPLIMVCGEKNKSLEKRLKQHEIAGLLTAPLDPRDVFTLLQEKIESGTRKNIRVAAALPALVRDDYGETEGFATVLSRFGMFFRTLEPRPVKDRVSVELVLWDQPVRVEAEVLYIVSFEEGPFCEPGMGMKFVTIEPTVGALISQFIYEQLGLGPEALPPGEDLLMGRA